jgi:hypothetical protein
MDISVALSTHDQRFALYSDHPLHPDWRFITTCPPMFQVGQFANVVNFAVFFGTTEFAFVRAETFRQVVVLPFHVGWDEICQRFRPSFGYS